MQYYSQLRGNSNLYPASTDTQIKKTQQVGPVKYSSALEKKDILLNVANKSQKDRYDWSLLVYSSEIVKLRSSRCELVLEMCGGEMESCS